MLRLSLSRVQCVAELLGGVGWIWKAIGLEPDNKNIIRLPWNLPHARASSKHISCTNI